MHVYDFYDDAPFLFFLLSISCVLFFCCLNFNVLCFVLKMCFYFSPVNKKIKNAMN